MTPDPEKFEAKYDKEAKEEIDQFKARAVAIKSIDAIVDKNLGVVPIFALENPEKLSGLLDFVKSRKDIDHSARWLLASEAPAKPENIYLAFEVDFFTEPDLTSLLVLLNGKDHTGVFEVAATCSNVGFQLSDNTDDIIIIHHEYSDAAQVAVEVLKELTKNG